MNISEQNSKKQSEENGGRKEKERVYMVNTINNEDVENKMWLQKCIDFYVDNERYYRMHVADMIDGMKNMGISIKSRTVKKEVSEIFKQNITPDNIYEFEKIDRFGLSKSDIKKIFNISEYKLNRLINEEKINDNGYYESGFYRNWYYVYKISDCCKYIPLEKTKRKL